MTGAEALKGLPSAPFEFPVPLYGALEFAPVCAAHVVMFEE